MQNREYTDPMVMNLAAQAVSNAIQTRRDLFRSGTDTRRSIEDECGYCDPMNIRIDDFKQMYQAEPVAARVVQVMPLESWKVSPTLYETQFGETTEFEEAWNTLASQLSGYSWHQQEEGSVIWNILQQADIVSGIGRYGVILLGINDGLSLEKPIAGVEEALLDPNVKPKRKENLRLLYLRAFDESQAPIESFETNDNHPRYGKPKFYNITFEDPKSSYAGQTSSLKTYKVHWTRIIHLADDCEGSEVFGTPRQRPVWRRLLDIQKIYGGSSEMFWKGGFPGYSFETHPSLGGDVIVDDDEFKNMVEQWMNGLQRVVRTSGMQVKSITPQVADPVNHIKSQIEAICIQKGIPNRIFCGSERGDLASTQDTMAWNARLAGRQNRYLTPNLIVPFANRLITIGILPTPKQYLIEWPDLNTLNMLEYVDRSLKMTKTIAEYVKGGVEALIPPKEFLTYMLPFTDEQADAFLQAAEQHDPISPLLNPPEPVEKTEEKPKEKGNGEEAK